MNEEVKGMSTEERVKKILVGIGIGENEIAPEKTLRDQLGIDSAEMVEIIVSLEKEFNITIPAGKPAQLKTVRDIINFVEGK
jgi:acyl carrier protein